MKESVLRISVTFLEDNLWTIIYKLSYQTVAHFSRNLANLLKNASIRDRRLTGVASVGIVAHRLPVEIQLKGQFRTLHEKPAHLQVNPAEAERKLGDILKRAPLGNG